MKYRILVLTGLCALLLISGGCASVSQLQNKIAADMAGQSGDNYYRQKNFSAAFSKYQEAANLEGASSQFMLATMYLEGVGIEKDYEKYVFWMSRSAANGYAPANFAMGHEKLQDDPMAAYDHFRRAAEQEHGGAMYALGFMYATGYGVSQSNYEALRWFRLARAQSYPVASELLNEATITAYVEREMQKVQVEERQYTREEIVTHVQQELAKLGYNPGVADGIYGKKTRSAIEAFQKDQDLEVDGKASMELIGHLQAAQAQ